MRDGIAKPFAKLNNGTQIHEAFEKRHRAKPGGLQELEDKFGLQKDPG